MKIEYLEYLVTLYEAGSVNKASKLLHTSPQNVSRVMKQLEDELDFTLFDRMAQGVVFNEEGKEVVSYAKKILTATNELKYAHKKKENSNKIEGHLNVVSTCTQNLYFLNDLMLNFNKIYPKIKLSLIETDFINGIRLVNNNTNFIGFLPQFNIGNFSTTPAEYRNDLNFCKLNDDKICIIAAKDTPIGKQKSISFQALKDYDIAMFVRNNLDDSFWVKILKHYNLSHKISFVSGSGYTFYKEILENDLIGLTSLKAFTSGDFYNNEKNKNRIQIIELRGENVFNNCLVTKKDIFIEPHISCFLAYLKNVFKSELDSLIKMTN